MLEMLRFKQRQHEFVAAVIGHVVGVKCQPFPIQANLTEHLIQSIENLAGNRRDRQKKYYGYLQDAVVHETSLYSPSVNIAYRAPDVKNKVGRISWQEFKQVLDNYLNTGVFSSG